MEYQKREKTPKKANINRSMNRSRQASHNKRDYSIKIEIKDKSREKSE